MNSIEEIIKRTISNDVLLYLNGDTLKYRGPKVIDKQLHEDIKKNKEEIISFLKNAGKSVERKLPDIRKRNPDKPLLLSYAQQRLWFIDQLEGNSAHYNLPIAFRLNGILKIKAFKQALRDLLERHEVLRTRFNILEGEPVQVVQEAFELPLTQLDLSGLEASQQEAELQVLAQQDAIRPFDLSRDLMLRVQLIKLSRHSYGVLLNMHHIASDGWSQEILVREFNMLYEAHNLGKADPLPPLPVQYADFAAWQRDWLQGEVLEEQLAYWRRQLEGLPLVHSLPLDRPRPLQQNFTGQLYSQKLGTELAGSLSALCQSQGVTLFMLLQSAFSALLSRYSNENDIVMGSPIAGRTHKDFEGLIGLFLNTLVLRNDLSDEPCFSEFLQRSKQMILHAYNHQHVPFEMLVEVLNPARSLSHSPLFQIMFTVQSNEQAPPPLLSEVALEELKTDGVITKFDLELSIKESEQGLSLSWVYNKNIFYPETIERLAKSFGLLLEGIVEDIDIPIHRINILTEEDQQKLLVYWNNTRKSYPDDQCVHELIEIQAELYPDSIAVVYEENQLTYGELNEKSNQLAHYLIERGVGPDVLVGLYIERSLEMVIGLLGILKAGSAYVPLDSGYPTARLEYMLNDSGATVLVTQASLVDRLSIESQEVICLDDDGVLAGLAGHKPENPTPDTLSSDHLAYVIYTSGSTGQPKGVCISHKSFHNLLQSMAQQPGLSRNNRLLAVTPLSFDIAGLEIVLPLIVGAQLHIASALTARDGQLLSAYLTENDIDVMQATPATWLILSENSSWKPKLLFKALSGGEALAESLAYRLNSRCNEVWNMYGPTETTIWSTCRKITDEVNIGYGIANTRLYILSDQLGLQPIGSVGQLYISGDGLARGYLNQPELTKGKYISNPFLEDATALMYKTGDLARWLPDGNLMFLGRKDEQVKLRGFRIELGEIESQLRQIEGVRACVVLCREDAGVEKGLVAYLVAEGLSIEADILNDGQAGTLLTRKQALSAQYQSRLRATLPDYMVPDIYVFLDSLPLTPNGKVDRKALLAPDEDDLKKEAYMAPRNETEEKLNTIWRDILNLERIGIKDNFFNLGGHSLLAMRLISAIREVMDVELSVRSLFEQPTIAGLAQALTESADKFFLPAIQPADRSRALPLSYAQQRLWFIDQLGKGSAHYNLPVAFKLNGTLRINAFEQTLRYLLTRHEVLRTSFRTLEGEAVQVIHEKFDLPLTRLDLSDLEALRQEEELQVLAKKDALRPFDLSQDLMLRVQLIKLSPRSHAVLFNMHHIAGDGWSQGILVREFGALYEACLQNCPDSLPALPIQYADYAAWQRDWLQGEILESQLAYWLEQLRDIPEVHNLPLDKPRPPQQRFAGRSYHQSLNKTLTDSLNALCQSHGVTLFMLLQSAFSVLLSRYSNETVIVVGTATAGRTHKNIEGLIGFFINDLVLRSEVSGEVSFSTFLQQNKQMILEAYAHQHIPFEMLVEKLNPARSLSYNPVFQVKLNLQNNEQSNLDLTDLELVSLDSKLYNIRYDLSVNALETSQELFLSWSYNTDIFSPQTIERLSESFRLLLESIAATPDKAIHDLNILTEKDRRKLMVDWNDTAAPYPVNKCIHELFEAQALLQPQQLAVAYQDKSLTYKQLNERSNRLAHYLKERGVVPDTLVALCMERSLEMVIGILGILKAGGAFVPLDPAYPASRLRYMLTESAAKLVLTSSGTLSKLDLEEDKILTLDGQMWETLLGGYPASNIEQADSGLLPHHLAYVIYTSGSTGQPKGVMVNHTSLVNYVMALISNCRDVSDSFVNTNICFDGTGTSFWSSFVMGKSLKLTEFSDKGSFDDLVNEIADGPPRIFKITPTHLNALLETTKDSESCSQHNIFVGGETFLKQKYRKLPRWLKNARIFNHYGPSEATIGCAVYPVDAEKIDSIIGDSIPIGKPIRNTQLYVLNSNLRIQPIGVPGELHIGGASLARGYLNNMALTEEKFIPNPFYDAASLHSSQRLYKTGDVVRWLPDGDLEFIGRVDDQVKLRGFRIELAEIETRLLQIEGVKDCVVLCREDEVLGKRLVAYVVDEGMSAGADSSDYKEAETFLSRKKNLSSRYQEALGVTLPEYMVPRVYIFLDILPLTSNGKVNKKMLPAPEESDLQKEEFVAPRNETEEKLCEIWLELLDIEQVGVLDDFFDLGGHSLLVIKICKKIKEVFGREVSIMDIYTHANIESLAACIAADEELPEENSLVVMFSGTYKKRIPAGRFLYMNETVFQEEFNRCASLLKKNFGLSIAEIFSYSDDSIELEKVFSHPVLTEVFTFSLEYSIAKYWEHLGVRPSAVIGEGVGEYAAACIAGVFSLENALALLVAKFEYESESEDNSTIDDSMSVYSRLLQSIAMSVSKIPYVSCTLGNWATEEVAEVEYWKNHLSSGGFFHSGLEQLMKGNYKVLLEIGPEDALKRKVLLNKLAKEVTVLSTFGNTKESESEECRFMQTLSDLISSGVKVDRLVVEEVSDRLKKN